MSYLNVQTVGEPRRPYVFNFLKSNGSVEPVMVSEREYEMRKRQCQGWLKPTNSVVIFRDGVKVETLRLNKTTKAFEQRVDNKQWLIAEMCRCDERRVQRGIALQRDVEFVDDGKVSGKIVAKVPSSNGGQWTVEIVMGSSHTCNCEDAQAEGPGHVCKHQYAAMSMLAHVYPSVPTAGHRRALRHMWEKAELRTTQGEAVTGQTSDSRLYGGRNGFLAR